MSDNFVPRPPDYKLSALSKSTEARGNVGVAWKNDDGTIRINLNPFVVLDAGDSLVLTLFPADSPWAGKKKRGRPPKAIQNDEEGDIPVVNKPAEADIPF